MNIAAEIGRILIEFQIEKMKKEAAAGDNRQAGPAAAKNEASEPAQGHYAHRAADLQMEV